MLRRWTGFFAFCAEDNSARRQLLGDGGEDLVEYALIASFIGVAGYLVLMALGADIFNAYTSWLDPTVGVPSAWEPPPPSVGS